MKFGQFRVTGTPSHSHHNGRVMEVLLCLSRNTGLSCLAKIKATIFHWRSTITVNVLGTNAYKKIIQTEVGSSVKYIGRIPSQGYFILSSLSKVSTFWRKVLNEEERTRLVSNVAGHLKNAYDFIQRRAVHNFSVVDKDYGERMGQATREISCEVTI